MIKNTIIRNGCHMLNFIRKKEKEKSDQQVTILVKVKSFLLIGFCLTLFVNNLTFGFIKNKIVFIFLSYILKKLDYYGYHKLYLLIHSANNLSKIEDYPIKNTSREHAIHAT